MVDSALVDHVGGSLPMHSIMQTALIAGGKDTKEGRPTFLYSPGHPRVTSPTRSIKIYRDHERYTPKANGR